MDSFMGRSGAGPGRPAALNSASFESLHQNHDHGLPHTHSHSHHRGHRSSNTMNGHSMHGINKSGAPSTGSLHYEGNYTKSSQHTYGGMGEYLNSHGISLNHAVSGQSTLHGSNGVTKSGGHHSNSVGTHSKRQRGHDDSAGSTGAHQDALMELARENLLLKHQLQVASIEVSRLRSVVDGYEDMREESKDSAKSQSRYWTEQEHQRFLEAIQTIGHKDVKAIAQFVGTRSSTQVRTHAQKYFMKLARLKKQEESPGMNGCSNPDQDPSELVEGRQQARTSKVAAAAAAAGPGGAGTSAAAAAAYVAANSGQIMGSKQRALSAPTVVSEAIKAGRNPGSPNSMGSSGSVGSSDNTSNGKRSTGISASDNTNGHGSTGSSNSNSLRNRNGSSSDSGPSDSGRCGDSNNGASSNEGSEHGFFDTGAEEEPFADEVADDLSAGGGVYLRQEAEELARQLVSQGNKNFSYPVGTGLDTVADDGD